MNLSILCLVGLLSVISSGLIIPPLFGKYNTFYSLTNDPNGVENFSWIGSIKGRNDARILFSPNKNIQHGIEIIFGARGNSEIDVYDMHDGSGDFNYITPLYHGLILSEIDYRNYWINWINGEITIGFGKQLYKNMIFSYRNDALESDTNWTMPKVPPYHIRYCSYSSWDMPIEYKNIIIKNGIVPLPGGVFAVGAKYEQFNQPNMFWLSSSFFEVVVEVQGLSDITIGFLNSHKWNTEDIYAIEVVLNDAFNRQHTYPRNLIRSGTGNGGVIFALSNDTDVVSPVEFRPFWILYYNHKMRVGRGKIPGKNEFMSTDELLPSFPNKTVVLGFTSYFLSFGVRILSVFSLDIDWSLPTYLKTQKVEQISKKISKELPITFKTGTNKPYTPFIAPRTPQECLMQCKAFRPYSIYLPITARYQWWHNGAYCAEISIQQAAMSLGMYISQGFIRKITPYSGEHAFFGDSIIGYEVVPDNIMETFKLLGIRVASVKKNSSYQSYFNWIKHHLVKGHPVIWYVQTMQSIYVEHAESVFGYLSNHPLEESSYAYPDDLIAHYSGSDLLPYYRRVDSFMGKNCSKGISYGTECIPEKDPIAFALLNNENNLYITVSDNGKEPPPPNKIYIKATVHLKNLIIGEEYKIYKKVKTNTKTNTNTKIDVVHEFLAIDETYKWIDHNAFLSSSFVKYTLKMVPSFSSL